MCAVLPEALLTFLNDSFEHRTTPQEEASKHAATNAALSLYARDSREANLL